MLKNADGKKVVLTRTHIPGTPTAEGVTNLRACAETEVREFDLRSVVVAQNVVRLQIAMVNADTMAVLHSVEDLDEDTLQQL